MERKKIYFLSDAHLGSRAVKNGREMERKLCDFLTSIMPDAKAVYLLGDMFDFWLEYHNVVQKGFSRFLGKLSEMTDSGIEVHYFTGNHDIWTFGYLEEECGVILHRSSLSLTLSKGDGTKMKVFLAHGDGLGDGNRTFKLIRYIFHSKLCQWLYINLIHADLGIELGLRWAKQSRLKHSYSGVVKNEFGDVISENVGMEEPFKGEDKEELVLFAKEYLKKDPSIDCFIFGHRHIELDLMLQKDKRLIILGEWMNLCTYAVWDGEKLVLENF